MSEHPQHIVLVGMMGSGKTAVGRRLATLLGRPYLDNDTLVTAADGRPVTEIAVDAGADSLHEAEYRALRRAAASPVPAVIAAAGSVVLDEAGREAARAAGEVVWLRADPATLVRRIEAASKPLVGSTPAETIPRLDAARRSGYASIVDHVIDVDDNSPDEIAAELAAALRQRLRVNLGERSYEVVVGPGARQLVASLIPPNARRAVVVTQQGVGVELDTGIETSVFLIEDGESAKSLATVEELCRHFAKAGLTRRDVVIAVGGGVVTDVAGFAASCYLRGIAFLNVATTLLGQIDAAIGGKTGVNLPEGKNLVGAFWQPAAVLCDTDTLVSLPEREWRSGLGEMAKYAFLGVDDLDRLPLVEQVARCAALKVAIVSLDERESDKRAILNYGHTLAHALEAAGFAGEGPGRGGVDLRHGEAVAIGLVFAARLAKALGRIDDARVERHREIVLKYELPVEIPEAVDPEELVVFMARDKKATNGLTFVLDGPKGVELVHDVPRELVVSTLKAGLAGSASRGDSR